MISADTETRAKMIQRLKRIEGQVRGVQAMMAEGRSCEEILQQLSAVRSAVHSAMLVVIQNYITQCLLGPDGELDDRASREKLAASLTNILDRVP